MDKDGSDKSALLKYVGIFLLGGGVLVTGAVVSCAYGKPVNPQYSCTSFSA